MQGPARLSPSAAAVKGYHGQSAGTAWQVLRACSFVTTYSLARLARSSMPKSEHAFMSVNVDTQFVTRSFWGRPEVSSRL